MPIECVCKECGKKFKVKPSVIKNGGGKFCTKRCWYNWKSKNFTGDKNSNYGHRWSEEKKIEFSKNRIGENNPFYNKTHSIKTRLKIGFKGRHSEKTKELIRKSRVGSKSSEYTKYKMRLSHLGDKCNLWKGGISFDPYCPKFNDEFRNRVRFFWDYKCGNTECGKTQEENKAKLSVHHVHFDKQVCCNDKPAMFIPLCRTCHSITNGNPKKYIKIYEDLIIEKFNGKSYYTKEEYISFIKIIK